MAVRSEKKEVRMRRGRYGPPQWSFTAPTPGTEARFRRWNIVLIVILAFFVLGVFLVAKAPEPGSNVSGGARVSQKMGGAPISPNHVKSKVRSLRLMIANCDTPDERTRIDIGALQRASARFAA